MSLSVDPHITDEQRPRIMIVDDDPVIRYVMAIMLKGDYDVTALESGQHALEQVRRGEEFDVISLDLHMPGLSGIDTLKVVKELSPTTEVLIATAYSDIDSAKQALKLGAYDYIDKPFEKKALREAICNGVSRRRQALASQQAVEQLAVVKAQLAQSEKMSAIGELLAGVVHEINNPLSAVIGFSDLGLMREHPPEVMRVYMQDINRAALLCKEIVQNLLAFSRKHEPQSEPLDVNQVIEDTLKLKLNHLATNGIEVVKRLAPDLPPIMADGPRLQQVFLNLINNAHHAMRQQGPKGILTLSSALHADTVRVHFCDTGAGIPPEKFQTIFEPFYTTKEKGKGTGLGLSICSEIIREHRGSIYISSELGKGACFIVELPAVGG